MIAVIRPYTPADLAALRGLIERPGIAAQFDVFVGTNALEQRLADPRLPAECIRLAFAGDEPVGFGFAFVLPSPDGDWASPRIAVDERWRRRGLGRRLLDEVVAAVLRRPEGPGLVELSSTAWVPDAPVEGFAAAMRYEPRRWFWMMARARGGVPEPAWPEGVTTRAFVHDDVMLAAWNRVYNESFREHYHYVASTLDDARGLANGPAFRPDGLRLAWRDGRCVGFCRCELFADRVEIGALGVVREARGIGLGRALLRWGVRWLEQASPLPVTLLVDGENEGALGLYRAEGFEITRRRRVWSRAVSA